MSSCLGTTTTNRESLDFWIIWTTWAYDLPATLSPLTLTILSPMLRPASTAGPSCFTDLTNIVSIGSWMGGPAVSAPSSGG